MRPDFVEIAISGKFINVLRFMVSASTVLTPTEHENLIRVMFQNFFSTEAVDVTDLEVMKQLSRNAGISDQSIDRIVAVLESPDNKQLLKDNSERVVQLGGFGLPVTLVHSPPKPQFIFGSDRMHIIGHLLGEQAAPILK